MSEILIPRYYNVKIGNNDWQIYMGGERYFPAYPAKWVEPSGNIYIKNGIVYSADEITNNVVYIELSDEGVKNGIVYV